MVGDRDFSSSSLLGMRSKGVADDTLVAADLSLDQSASIVSAGSLPTATAPGGNLPDLPTAIVRIAQQRRNLRAVVDVTTGQRASDNLARDCIQADMQFVP